MRGGVERGAVCGGWRGERHVMCVMGAVSLQSQQNHCVCTMHVFVIAVAKEQLFLVFSLFDERTYCCFHIMSAK